MPKPGKLNSFRRYVGYPFLWLGIRITQIGCFIMGHEFSLNTEDLL